MANAIRGIIRKARPLTTMRTGRLPSGADAHRAQALRSSAHKAKAINVRRPKRTITRRRSSCTKLIVHRHPRAGAHRAKVLRGQSPQEQATTGLRSSRADARRAQALMSRSSQAGAPGAEPAELTGLWPSGAGLRPSRLKVRTASAFRRKASGRESQGGSS